MKKLCFFALLLSVIVAAGCSKDDTDPGKKPTLTIETLNYTIAETGGSAEASFDVNFDWTASVEYVGSDAKWLTLSPESGKAGKATLTMTAEANASKEERKATVRILYGGETPCVLSVVQSGINDHTDIAAFFDPLFAQELQKRGYVADAGHISFAEVKSITELNIYGKSSDNLGELTSLRGIEYFESLRSLACSQNQLTSLDVSKNTALKILSCYENQLTSLDVSKNTALEILSCNKNQLISLDVNQNTALTGLSCGNNRLTSLDVSKNTALTDLFCDNNQLTALDVSKNTVLALLHCNHNQLKSLEVNQNTALWQLYCEYNQLTSLDVSKNTALSQLHCNHNQLTSLNVSQNTALALLYCDYNQLTSLDVSKDTALSQLRCNHNRLTSLDISGNKALKLLSCISNPGDGAVFLVTAWFDNNNIPSRFTAGSWEYDGKTVRIDYRKAK